MTEKENFRKQFWKHKSTIGSLTPSSRFLAKKMLKNIDFETEKVFVELGSGTGVITNKIIQKMNKDAILLVFEVNDTFYIDLRNRITDKRVHLIHDSAENMEQYLAKFKLSKVDSVISSLPLAIFSEELRKSILLVSERALAPTGKFIQFQYSLQAKSELQNLFHHVDVEFTLSNIPPAFVYTCHKNQ